MKHASKQPDFCNFVAVYETKLFLLSNAGILNAVQWLILFNCCLCNFIFRDTGLKNGFNAGFFFKN